MGTSDLESLRNGWEKVIATRDSSPPGCACRNATGPLIDAWIGRITVRLDSEEIARSWTDLKKAQAAQTAAALLPPETGDYVLDVRTEREFSDRPRPNAINIPVDDLRYRLDEIPQGRRIVVFCQSGPRAERASFVLRNNGFHACNGHEGSCPISTVNVHHVVTDKIGNSWKRIRLDPMDPPLGATGIPSDILSGLLGAVQGAAADVGSAGAQGAAERTKAAIPGLAEAVRSEVPKTVSTVADAAKAEIPDVVKYATPAAESVSEAAGRGAAKGAREESGFSMQNILIGVATTLMISVALGVLMHSKNDNSK